MSRLDLSDVPIVTAVVFDFEGITFRLLVLDVLDGLLVLDVSLLS